MKIEQWFPLQYNARAYFELTDDRVIQTWKALNGSGRNEFLISDISPITGTSSQGERSLQGYAFFFIWCAVMAAFLKSVIGASASGVAFISFTGIAILCGLLYLFKKYDYEIFRSKSGETLFGIRKDSNQIEQFISELKSKLK